MPPGAGGEIQLTDGIARLLEDEKVLALRVRGPPLRLRQQARLSRRRRSSFGAEASRRSARRSREFLRSAYAMTFNELRYIVAVAQERSFGRAAQRCFISQPALSVAIQKLEEELGAQLFERGKAEVTVTPVGERIVEQAQKVLEEAAQHPRHRAGRTQPAGRRCSGSASIYTVAPYLLPDLIPALQRARAADAARRSRRT